MNLSTEPSGTSTLTLGHVTSGRWQYGLILSLSTSILWGSLPLIMKGLVEYLDPFTITWVRFLTAGLAVGCYLVWRGTLPNLRNLRGQALILASICIVGLLLNYNFYVFGIETITPSSAQVMIQFAPMLFLLGGIFIFRESFNLFQWLGFFTFLIGIILFFNQRFTDLFGDITQYGVGLGWIFLAAITWACYAIAQKQLLRIYSSANINLMIYAAGSLFLLPLANPAAITDLDINDIGWILLLLSCLNSVLAYGAFAEALNHWEASRVSAILALQPLFTIGFMRCLDYWYPGYLPIESLNTLSLIGAGLVVVGSMLTAIYRTKARVVK